MADKLVYILASLESILLKNDSEPIQKNLGERMAFLIGPTVEARKTIIANVVETYARRVLRSCTMAKGYIYRYARDFHA